MAFADPILTTAPTMEGVAALINTLLSSTGPLVMTSWTPTLGVTAPMTFTSTSIVFAKYFQIGKIVFFAASFSGTVGGTPGAVITMTLPVTAVSQGISAAVQVTDGGTAVSGNCSILTTTTIEIRRYNAAALTAGVVGPTLYGFYEVP